jgi:DNA-binding transcriptional regulator YiaG
MNYRMRSSDSSARPVALWSPDQIMNSPAPTHGVRSGPSTGDLESLYLELLNRYYEQGDRERASTVASRLEQALASSPAYAHSIRGEEVRSIIAELRGDLPTAIQSREAEIRKILELHELALKTKSWGYVSRLYDYGDVSDRLDLLAILYDKQGEVDRAIAILVESKNYCLSHQIPFDGQPLLEELEHLARAHRESITIPEAPSTAVAAAKVKSDRYPVSAKAIDLAQQIHDDGRVLRRLRQERGLSQVELARRAGVPVSRIRAFELGREKRVNIWLLIAVVRQLFTVPAGTRIEDISS